MYKEIEREKYEKIIKLVGEFEVISSSETVLIPMSVYSGILDDFMELISIDREHIEEIEQENQILILNTPQVEDVERGNYF